MLKSVSVIFHIFHPYFQSYQNGSTEEIDEFISTLRSQLEIFVNRMKSNQSRGRPIANDTAVQTLFMNITAMHAQLLKYIHQQDDKRGKIASCLCYGKYASSVFPASFSLPSVKMQVYHHLRNQMA